MEKYEKKRACNYNNSINNADNKNPKKKSALKRLALFLSNHFLYGWMRYSVILTGKIPSHFIRNFLYRFIYNSKITGETVIYGGCEIRSPWNFHAGKCIVMNNCIIDARDSVFIGENVVFGSGVHIWTEEHDVNSPTFSVTADHRGPVIIEHHAWICSDSTILPGIHVGEGAVLATRACAVKNLNPFCIYAGIPAKCIRERNKFLMYELSGKPHWYFY